MSNEWTPMTWKGKDCVVVNKKSWDRNSGFIPYKYEACDKVYRGRRANFSPSKKESISSNHSSTSFLIIDEDEDEDKRSQYLTPEPSPQNNNYNSCGHIGNEVNYGNGNNAEIVGFLRINRIESLQSCFREHDITIDDLNIWTEKDAKEYCAENGFAVHIKRRLINGINQLNPNPTQYSHSPSPSISDQMYSLSKQMNSLSKQMNALQFQTTSILNNLQLQTIATKTINYNTTQITTQTKEQCLIPQISAFVPKTTNFIPKITTHKTVFGKAGKRTAKQDSAVLNEYNRILAAIDPNELIIATDGACKGNPGPSGCGAVILFGKHRNIIAKIAASGEQRGTNHRSELYAIQLSLLCLLENAECVHRLNDMKTQLNINKININVLTDSTYSKKIFDGSWTAKTNTTLVNNAKYIIEKVEKSVQTAIKWHWIGGHVKGCLLNEVADQMANYGARAVQQGVFVDNSNHDIVPQVNQSMVAVIICDTLQLDGNLKLFAQSQISQKLATTAIKTQSVIHKSKHVQTSIVHQQHLSKCVSLILTINQYTNKHEFKLKQTSPTISSFFERKFGSNQWLKVTTSDYEIAFNPKKYPFLMDIARNGIVWNNKTWQYFGHKDHILYFFHETDSIKIKHVRQCLGDIYSTKSIAKFASRLSLGFSQTYPLHTLVKSANIRIIRDIFSNTQNVMTDGSGYIAVNLAKQIPYVAGGWLVNSQQHEYPLLVQCRLIFNGGLAKGTLVAHPDITDNEIHLRDSMVKIRNNTLRNMEYAMLEIINTSTVGSAATLNRSLNVILSKITDDIKYREYIDGLLQRYFEFLQEITQNPRVAFRKVSNLLATYHNNDNDDICSIYDYRQAYQLILEMILAGQQMSDPFIQHHLKKIITNSFDKLLYKNKIPVEKSRYLTGTYDPLDVLNENEVFIVSNVQITGQVLVSRHPLGHPGDVRIFTAVNNSELHNFIGYYSRNASGGIFFSVKGERAAADLLSNGDYDGDLYWVCYDNELIKLFDGKQAIEAAPIDFSDADKWNEDYKTDNTDLQWELVPKSPMEFKDDIDTALMTHFVLTNCNCMTMKMVHKTWLKSFELFGLFDNKTTTAIRCYFVALDAAKSGIKVSLPAHITNSTKGVIYGYDKDLNKKRRSTKMKLIATDSTHSILMHVFEKVQQFQRECDGDDIKRNVDDILDMELLGAEGDNFLADEINEFDGNFARDFARLKQKYEDRKQRELIDGYDNFDQRKAIQYEYNAAIFALKQKYKTQLQQYCVDKNISIDLIATMLYEISYRKVFASMTRKSYWIPWIICGDVLNKIRANLHCQNNENVIAISPKMFKNILLRKSK